MNGFLTGKHSLLDSSLPLSDSAPTAGSWEFWKAQIDQLLNSLLGGNVLHSMTTRGIFQTRNIQLKVRVLSQLPPYGNKCRMRWKLTSKLHIITWFPDREYAIINPETRGSITQCNMPTFSLTTGLRSALMWMVIIVSSVLFVSFYLATW